MKKLVNVAVCSMCMLTLSSAFIPTLVSAKEYFPPTERHSQSKKSSLNITPEIQQKLNIIRKIQNELEQTKLGFINIKVTNNILAQKYNLSEEDLSYIQNTLNSINEGVANRLYRTPYIEDWHLILTADDCRTLVYAVDTIGPAAVSMALATICSAVPGAGTIIGGVIGFFGAAAILGNASYAMATNKKLKLGLTGVSVID